MFPSSQLLVVVNRDVTPPLLVAWIYFARTFKFGTFSVFYSGTVISKFGKLIFVLRVIECRRLPFRVFSLSPRIAKLRQLIGLSNWAIFCDHLRSIAHATGLTGYLNGTIVAPSPQDTVSSIASSSQKTSTDDASTTPSAPTSTPSAPPPTPINSRTPSVEEWELRDGCLAGIIYQNIKDPRSIGVTEIMSAHEMWTRLTSEYDTSSAAAQALAKEHIQQFQYAPGTPFEEYFKQLEAPAKLRVMLELKRVLVEYDMMVESASPSSTTFVAPNAHSKKNCWAKGGGSEGKAPRWYNAPKGMEPTLKSVTAASIQEEEKHFAAAATVYDFSDYDFGGMVELSNCPNLPNAHPPRLGIQETLALLSDSPNPNVAVPTFIDSGASHWCIRSPADTVKLL
ncbi:hypothetical protein F5880DRAFT_1635594 [Lentinula raphanica]|nr:hypothetical protein F5880DRAFT_1635594 [Lentinula raphanica]